MAVSRSKIIYLEAGGQYRKRRGVINANLPNYLLNMADKQGHVLKDGPIFPETRPVRVRSFRDLVDADMPPHPRQVEARVVFCEDNAIWPISPNPYQDSQTRNMQVKEAGQEAHQKSILQASREDSGTTLNKGAYVGAAIVAGLFALLIVIILLPRILDRMTA